MVPGRCEFQVLLFNICHCTLLAGVCTDETDSKWDDSERGSLTLFLWTSSSPLASGLHSLTPCPVDTQIQTAYLDSELLIHMILLHKTLILMCLPSCWPVFSGVPWPTWNWLLPFVIYLLSFNKYSQDTSKSQALSWMLDDRQGPYSHGGWEIRISKKQTGRYLAPRTVSGT